MRTKHPPDSELRFDDQTGDGDRRVSGKRSAEFPEPTVTGPASSARATAASKTYARRRGRSSWSQSARSRAKAHVPEVIRARSMSYT
jgi:hypothetical protein